MSFSIRIFCHFSYISHNFFSAIHFILRASRSSRALSLSITVFHFLWLGKWKRWMHGERAHTWNKLQNMACSPFFVKHFSTALRFYFLHLNAIHAVCEIGVQLCMRVCCNSIWKCINLAFFIRWKASFLFPLVNFSQFMCVLLCTVCCIEPRVQCEKRIHQKRKMRCQTNSFHCIEDVEMRWINFYADLLYVSCHI